MLILRRCLFASLAAIVVLASTGCIGLAANLIHAGWGNQIDARFAELAMSRVAVVCLSNTSSFGNTSAAEEVAERVEKKLEYHIPEITIVNQEAIAAWMDENDWNETDYRELADGLDVDYLIAIDLESFSLYEGQTLYKGRADVSMRVYKTRTDEVPYEIEGGLIQYPLNGGLHSADTDEKTFRAGFLDVVASRLARHFYSYDAKEDYGRDQSFVVQ